MFYLLLTGVLLFAVFIAFQDLKSRSVSIIYLVGFSVFVAVFTLTRFPLQQLLYYFLYNIVFLLLQAVFLVLYYYIKYRDLKKLPASIGGADIWVFLIFAFSLEPVVFIFFMTVAFIVALLYYGLVNFVLKKTMHEIPLAGVLCICYIVYTISNSLVN